MATDRFTLSDVTVINPGGERLPARSLSVRDGRIERIAPSVGAPTDPALARYAGTFILPGLTDMHTHLPPATPLNLTPYFCLLYLAHGVTSIRDTGDADGSAVPAARAGIASGSFPGPRVFACGPFVGGDAPQRWRNTLRLARPGDAAAAVRQIKAAGFNCVKAYDDLTLEQIGELRDAARQAGLRVIGHVPTRLGYEEALLPEPQHFFGVPEPKDLGRDHILNRNADWQNVGEERLERIVEVTLKHGLVNTPTLVVGKHLLYYADYAGALRDPLVRLMPRLFREVVWHPQQGMPVYRNLSPADLDRIREASAKKRDLVGRLHRRGAKLLIGTDMQPFTVPGASLHEEMALFVESGLTPEETWTIATRGAGEALGVADLGLLEDGAPADLLVFREDPTRSLGALKTLMAVVAAGRLYPKETLDQSLQDWSRHFEGALFDSLSIGATRRLMRRTITRAY